MNPLNYSGPQGPIKTASLLKIFFYKGKSSCKGKISNKTFSHIHKPNGGFKYKYQNSPEPNSISKL